ncbi:hypothetical protein HYS84_03740 [Candidatus Saccharibacteria bacterium]|nr:hypothetical protein [Candidatus Saccharibacteria bacterium]
MHTGTELRALTYKKIRTIKRLIKEEEWEVAAYLMGYVLECALKAASCKALRLATYPPLKSRGEVLGFKTHEFEQLLAVSGLSDLFGSVSLSPAYNNWSAFTINYPGAWTIMRYEDVSAKFDEMTVKELAKTLYDDSDSIIETIKRNRRW